MRSTTENSIPIADADVLTQIGPSGEIVGVSRRSDVIGHRPVGKRQLSVLIADDYRDAADSLAMLVGLWGHLVWVARDGATAVAMAAAYHPDVLLLDVGMPKVDGYHVARHLRGQPRFQDTLLIAITGWADHAHCLQGLEAGFDHYLVKPVDPSTLEVLLTVEASQRATRRRCVEL